MPIEPTPFEHVVVAAVATKATGDVVVDPVFGLVTVTVAKAGAATNDRNTQMKERAILMSFAFGIPVDARSRIKTGTRTALHIGKSNGGWLGEKMQRSIRSLSAK